MAVDPAWGGGDFVASPVCYQYGEDIYIADVVYDNRDKTFTQPHIVDTAIKYNVAAIRVEATKMTAEYADGIDEELKNKGKRVNVEKTTKHYTGNGKVQRIFDKAPDIREHMIFLEEGHRSKEYELFMQNVYSFSINGKNKHDDAPDSLAMAVNMALFGGNEVRILKRVF
jgi:predicted phage terminase large subunit-like protein